MSSSVFRQITQSAGSSKPERLFRAAVSAFCALTRPSRRDIAQLEDLTLPLFDSVTVEAKRYVAAALSECKYPPENLVKLLCDESVDIAAPLLIRSRALADVDLIALIGRHGQAHARSIARRPGLHPTIAELAAALDRASPPREIAMAASIDRLPVPGPKPERGEAAETTRRQLRGMMEPAGVGSTGINRFAGAPTYAKLRETALTGNRAFFQTALSDALEVDYATTGRIIADPTLGSLSAALRALKLTEEQAFVIASALAPLRFAHPEAIRLFLSRFALLHPDMALEQLRRWKAETLASSWSRLEPRASARAHNDALPSTRPGPDLRIRAGR